jgi:hypothetical protein
MEKLLLLEKKIDELIKKIESLKHENEQFLSEQKFIREESIKSKKILVENEKLVNDKIIIKKKISELLDKFKQVQI